jgi:hypothetical protein
VVYLIYSEWVKKKLDEVLSWQINKPDDNDDGGLQAEKPHGQGGVWSTSEAVNFILEHKILDPNDSRIRRAESWLLRHRNSGGNYGEGWPLINKGKSYVGTTASSILAISFFSEDQETFDALRKAKDWLIENQNKDHGWGMWENEDSLVSTTYYALLALKRIRVIFNEDKIELAIQNGASWIKSAQNSETHLWGSTKNSQETNVASTCQAVLALFDLGEDPKKYTEALNFFLTKFREHGVWQTVEELYTLKFYGEGLDQRLSWFIAPRIIWALVYYARSLPQDIGTMQIVEAVESLKTFDCVYESKEATDISLYHLDIRPWASAQYLKGLLEAQAYLQEHRDEYISIMRRRLKI